MTNSQDPPPAASASFDLGTTYSCLYLGKKCVPIEYGEPTYPSKVAITRDGYSLPAKNVPCESATLAKRLIGRTPRDGRLEKDIRNIPFAKLCDNGAEYLIAGTHHAPEEIYGYFHALANKAAEAEAGRPIESWVLAVPAYFGHHQRNGVLDGAFVGGLRRDQIKLVDEPVAVLVDYLDRCPENGLLNGLTLVLDPGGGTTDIAVVVASMINDNLTLVVKATAGDNSTGGVDVDRSLRKYVMKKAGTLQFKPDHDVLLAECEAAKRSLSTTAECATVHIRGPDGTVPVKVTREVLLGLCKPVHNALTAAFEDLTDSPTFDLGEVQHILLAGGSSHLPGIEGLCKEWCKKATILRSNGAETVARGAAIIASDPKIRIHMTLPQNIGIEAHDGPEGGLHMAVILERHSQLPQSASRDFFTKDDDQKELEIRIFEGNHGDASLNTLLGSFEINDIPSGKAGQLVRVTVHVPELGIVEVTATLGDTKESLTVKSEPRLTEEVLDLYRQRTAKRILGIPLDDSNEDGESHTLADENAPDSIFNIRRQKRARNGGGKGSKTKRRKRKHHFY